MAMTVPVFSAQSGQAPQAMAMTVPVFSGNDAFKTFQFVLPADINAKNAPEPLDKRVHLR